MNLIANIEGASPFDQIRQVDADGNEYWLARQLQPLLGYTQWRRFEETIERAKLACQNSGYSVDNHFADAGNLVKRPQGGGNRQADYKLSRYACYLTAMNGDPRKAEIAAAQTYFALKTREAEIGSSFGNSDVLIATITAAVEQALTPINQRLEQIEQRLSALPSAKPKRPWTLSANTPPEQIPEGYQQLEDGSWLSPEAYQSILRQSQRSLPWDVRRLRNYE
ncbi:MULTISPECIES: BRO family protein [unclassified Nostoc]|uniref:BRO family protein n=1 Tax=unclassified Nostoc TaxID=2593658 RepID=UPI0025ED8153|nr:MULTISPECIES: BRO family protein [unclassified Nostoc]